MEFQLESPFQPAGDQPQAIEQLVAGLRSGRRHQVLMGVTGSGRAFKISRHLCFRSPALRIRPVE